MPIRQMQQFTQLLQNRPEAIRERRLILEAHQHNVEQHIEELQQNLAVIHKKIRLYKELEHQASSAESSKAEAVSITSS